LSNAELVATLTTTRVGSRELVSQPGELATGRLNATSGLLSSLLSVGVNLRDGFGASGGGLRLPLGGAKVDDVL
jgi:hypothetical protein